MTRLDSVQDGCWVNLTYPSEDELNTVAVTLGVEPSFLRAALDEEETSRIDTEDGQTLIIIDVPAVEKDDAVVYSTLPLGIIVTDKHIITVCLKETSILKDFQDGLVRFAETQKRTSFILYMLLQVAKRFLQYLKQIDRSTTTWSGSSTSPSETRSSFSSWIWKSHWSTSTPRSRPMR